MPTLGNKLNFAQYEAQNLVVHLTNPAPSGAVKGQLYFNNVSNTLWYYDGTTWVQAGAAGALAAHATTHQPGGSDPMAVDAAVGTGSLRTLGNGSVQAMPGNYRLDQIAAPTALVSLNGQRLTSVADPTASTDGANKQYVDNLSSGLDAKASVKVATTANITLSGTQTIDGYSVLAGDRVLVKNQSSSPANGIYVAASGAWTRAADMDSWAEVPASYVWVEQGTTQQDTGWLCTSDAGGVLETNNIIWVQFSGAAMMVAGGGLTRTQNTLDVGQGYGLVVNADDVALNRTLVPSYYSTTTHAAGTTWTYTQATHGCSARQGLIVQCQVAASGAVVLPDIVVTSGGDVTVTFGVSQTLNTIRTTIIG